MHKFLCCSMVLFLFGSQAKDHARTDSSDGNSESEADSSDGDSESEADSSDGNSESKADSSDGNSESKADSSDGDGESEADSSKKKGKLKAGSSKKKGKLKAGSSRRKSKLKAGSSGRNSKLRNDPSHRNWKHRKPDVGGWYIGAGIMHSVSRAKVIHESMTYEGNARGYRSDQCDHLTDNLGQRTGITSCEIQNDRFKAKGNIGIDFVSGKNRQMGGSICAGYGAFFCHDIYAGANITVDCAGSSKCKDNMNTNTNAVVNYEEFELKQNALSATLACMTGVRIPAVDAMLYLRFGAAYITADAHNKFGNIKLSKITPVVGAGIGKQVDNFSIRLEYDYRFPCDQTTAINSRRSEQINGVDTDVSISSDVRLKSIGHAIRFMAVYHIGKHGEKPSRRRRGIE